MIKEWENEPYLVEFVYIGYNCLIWRNPALKFLCGYVGLPEGNKYYGVHYDEIDLNVHGGFTFAGSFSGERKSKCEDNNNNLWWIGFDCGHYGDYIPSMEEMFNYIDFDIEGAIEEDIYRNIDYVKSQIYGIVEQITYESIIFYKIKSYFRLLKYKIKHIIHNLLHN